MKGTTSDRTTSDRITSDRTVSLTSIISDLYLCTTEVVRSTVTGQDSNHGFAVPVHRSTMPQINMIPHPVTLN